MKADSHLAAHWDEARLHEEIGGLFPDRGELRLVVLREEDVHKASAALRPGEIGWLAAIGGGSGCRLSWLRREASGELRWTSRPLGSELVVEDLPRKGGVRERLERWFDRRSWWRRNIAGSTPSEIMARIGAGGEFVAGEPEGREEWLALDPSIPAALLERAGQRLYRQGAGRFYTPPGVAAELCRSLIGHASGRSLAKATLLDMAVGAGGLLIAWVREVAQVRAGREGGGDPDLLRREAAEGVFGVDPDEEALRIARWRLKRFTGLEGTLEQGDFMNRRGLGRRKYDFVIGNPPWGAEREAGKRARLKRSYPQLPALSPDRALAFTCRALEVLKPGGGLGVLLPAAWLRIRSAEAFRRWLLEYEVREVREYGGGVFPGAVVESLLLVVRQARAVENVRRTLWLRDRYARIQPELSADEAGLMARLCREHAPFRDLAVIRWGIKPYQVGRGSPKQTREVVEQRSFHAAEALGPEWKPLAVGGEIDRYRVTFSGSRYLRYGPWLMYPSSEAMMIGPKLLLRQTSDTLRCAYDDTGLYAQNSLFLIHSDTLPLYYLLALLNSRLLGFLYRRLNPQQGKVFAEIQPSIIDELPIARGEPGEEERIAALAREVSARRGEGTAALEAEIDQRVEALYRISAESLSLLQGRYSPVPVAR